MKPGSLVECVDASGTYGLKEKARYIVNETTSCMCGKALIGLVEVPLAPNVAGTRCTKCQYRFPGKSLWKVSRFRELQIPPSIEEQIKESLKPKVHETA